MDGPAEDRQRVHPVDLGIHQIGLVPLPAGLVLLGAAMVVDGEQDRSALGRRSPQVDTDLPQ